MPRCFAILPAAGLSSRMGQPKLLMRLEERPLILHTIDAWRRSRVDCIFIVIRPGDDALAEVVRTAGSELVIPESPPPDMKASVQAALLHIAATSAPIASDAFLVAPADMPRLSPAVVNRLIDKHFSSGQASILVPTIFNRRGHPVLFPWPCAADVHSLQPDEGLNAIVERADPWLVLCEDLVMPNEYPFADIDTPDDFRKLSSR
jgi:molybdenum cofactor cytidylyltransferase